MTTTSLATNAGILLGTAAKVERAMPVVNSELMSRTPSEPRISCAKATPEVGTVTARSPPCAAMAAAASGSEAARSANCPVPQADRAPKPTMTTAVEASRIIVDRSVRNLMNSEFRTRKKLGPGPGLAALRMAARPGPGWMGVDVLMASVASGLGGNRGSRGDQRVVFDLVL